MMKPPPPPPDKPDVQGRQEDPYIIQRLALATYKSKYPSAVEALHEARQLLLTLNPKTSNDPETLGLWGAVHKRLWEEGDGTKREHLDESIKAYARGFYMLDDYYNGINLAYLLNVRASERSDPAEAVTDFVLARRVRAMVVPTCERELASLGEEPDAETADSSAVEKYRESRYWILATIAQAYVGMGQEAEAQQKLDEASKVAAADWMRETTAEQIEKLRRLLADSPLRHVKAGGD